MNGKEGVGAKQQVIPISLNLPVLLISNTGLADEGPLQMIVKLGSYYFLFIIKHHTLTYYFVCVFYISVNIDHVIYMFLFIKYLKEDKYGSWHY